MQLAESLSSAQSANEMREIGDALAQQIAHRLDFTNRRISDQISYLCGERDSARSKVSLVDHNIVGLYTEILKTELPTS